MGEERVLDEIYLAALGFERPRAAKCFLYMPEDLSTDGINHHYCVTVRPNENDANGGFLPDGLVLATQQDFPTRRRVRWYFLLDLEGELLAAGTSDDSIGEDGKLTPSGRSLRKNINMKSVQDALYHELLFYFKWKWRKNFTELNCTITKSGCHRAGVVHEGTD